MNNGRRTDSVDSVIYARSISKYIERKFIGGFRIRGSRIWISRGIL